MSYWCLSIWRSVCYSSICDYWCCCSCFPDQLLKQNRQTTDRDDDWGIQRDESGRLTVSGEKEVRRNNSYSGQPLVTLNSSITPNDEEPENQKNMKESPTPISISKPTASRMASSDGWMLYRSANPSTQNEEELMDQVDEREFKEQEETRS
jgi:hypothetical protein